MAASGTSGQTGHDAATADGGIHEGAAKPSPSNGASTAVAEAHVPERQVAAAPSGTTSTVGAPANGGGTVAKPAAAGSTSVTPAGSTSVAAAGSTSTAAPGHVDTASHVSAVAAPPDSTVAKPDAAADSAAQAASGDPPLRDGTYYGWGSSRHGDIQARVVIDAGRIVSASIAQCLTRYSCSWIAKLPPQVVERQSPEVDYVSGATQSTNAFYYAVVDALTKAK